MQHMFWMQDWPTGQSGPQIAVIPQVSTTLPQLSPPEQGFGAVQPHWFGVPPPPHV
jgi:hypothetical protein